MKFTVKKCNTFRDKISWLVIVIFYVHELHNLVVNNVITYNNAIILCE